MHLRPDEISGLIKEEIKNYHKHLLKIGKQINALTPLLLCAVICYWKVIQ